MSNQKTSQNTLGADIRALRKSRQLTLSELAKRVNRSVGWLSQVERDQSRPSVDEVKQIARQLDAPPSLLFGDLSASEDEIGVVVRAKGRRHIRSSIAGLSEALLSPDLTDDFEVVHSTFAPGSSRIVTEARPTQELAFLISGKLDVKIANKHFQINAGDSFRVRNQAFSWVNAYDRPAVAIWVIAPPIY